MMTNRSSLLPKIIGPWLLRDRGPSGLFCLTLKTETKVTLMSLQFFLGYVIVAFLTWNYQVWLNLNSNFYKGVFLLTVCVAKPGKVFWTCFSNNYGEGLKQGWVEGGRHWCRKSNSSQRVFFFLFFTREQNKLK